MHPILYYNITISIISHESPVLYHGFQYSIFSLNPIHWWSYLVWFNSHFERFSMVASPFISQFQAICSNPKSLILTLFPCQGGHGKPGAGAPLSHPGVHQPWPLWCGRASFWSRELFQLFQVLGYDCFLIYPKKWWWWWWWCKGKAPENDPKSDQGFTDDPDSN